MTQFPFLKFVHHLNLFNKHSILEASSAYIFRKRSTKPAQSLGQSKASTRLGASLPEDESRASFQNIVYDKQI
jgi:hypothetical protein